MASTDNKSSAGSSDHLVEDPNAASSNAQDKALLKALQALIVPLIHQTMGRNDIEQMPLGPEAGKLITALKEFISSVVHSQPEEKNTVTVDLSEEDIERHATISERQESSDHDSKAFVPGRLEKSKPQPISQDMVFEELRKHVFNKMPIRLLCFEHLGSGLRISLVERNTIYLRIKDVMREQIGEEQLYPQYVLHRHESDKEVIERLIARHAGYAILSHTWLRTTSGEVTYGDWTNGQFDANNVRYQKLVNFCTTAWRDHHVSFGWMDTVCINKDSSSELDESIRSMYNWYQRASMCIVYLAETETLSDMHLDPWFTRGWTLQELLAPDVLKFYNADWKRFSGDSENDKMNMQVMDQIERATTISADEFDPIFIYDIPISRRMQLAAQRQVTREEDAAYSLMGIFNVSFATAYGEGAARAFSRLLQEILATTDKGVLDIFNWAGPNNYVAPHNSLILPGHIGNYKHRSTLASEVLRLRPIEPITLTPLGLRVPVILMPAISALSLASEYDPIGHYYATVDIHSVDSWHSDLCTTYQLLDKNTSGPDGERIGDDWVPLSFAVFNFTSATANTICISKTCFAMALQCIEDVGKVSASSTINVIKTNTPIVFNLDKKPITGGIDTNKLGRHYLVRTDELPKHGMQLVTLYL